MNDLVAFFKARLYEAEQVARGATPGPWVVSGDDDEYSDTFVYAGDAADFDSLIYVAQTSYDLLSSTMANSDADATHIARHDPARVLADIEAKRRIVELYEREHENVFAESPWGGCSDECQWDALLWVIRQHAAAYADHPDFDPAWGFDG